jgi:hypothetical protein
MTMRRGVCENSHFDSRDRDVWKAAGRGGLGVRTGWRAEGRDWARAFVTLIRHLVNGIRSRISQAEIVVTGSSHDPSVQKKCRSRIRRLSAQLATPDWR